MSATEILRQAIAAQLWLLRSPDPELAELGRLSLELGLVADVQAPWTACTDGSVISLGPRFLAYPPPVRRYIIAHEVIHCARGHLWRLPASAIANRAADMEIEWSLRDHETQEFRLPTPAEELAVGCFPVRCPAGWERASAEVLLARLLQMPQQASQSGQSGQSGQGGQSGQSGQSGQGGQSGQSGQGSPDPAALGAYTAPGALVARLGAAAQSPGRCAMDKIAQGRVTSAGQHGQSADSADAGEGPDAIRARWERAALRSWSRGARVVGESIVAAASPRPHSWVGELSAHLLRRLSEPTWRRGSRRLSGSPVLYPGRQERQRIVILIRDTSGSIPDEELAEITEAILVIQRQLHAALILADADEEVRRWVRVPYGAPLPEEWIARAAGRGGTDYRTPVRQMLRIARDGGGDPHGIVYVGDLCVRIPDGVPSVEDAEGVPLVYLRTGGQQRDEHRLPYGDVVSME